MKPLFAVADPEKAGDLCKKYRFAVFPEDKFDDLKYQKKAAAIFEKYHKVEMTAHIMH